MTTDQRRRELLVEATATAERATGLAERYATALADISGALASNASGGGVMQARTIIAGLETDCCALPDGGCPGCSNCPAHCVCTTPVTVTDEMVERFGMSMFPSWSEFDPETHDEWCANIRAALTAALTEEGGE